jgi:GTP:adenosylcobinamide-phosphate guanylyltransferase
MKMYVINKAMVLADRLGAELKPLNDRTCVAMLPVAGKPVVQHVVEQLAGAGVREVFVILSAWAEQVEALLGDGTRFGMRIRYGLSRGEEPADVLIARSGQFSAEPCLVMRGDMLTSFDLTSFTERAAACPEPVVLGTTDGRAVVALRRGQSPALRALGWTGQTLADISKARTLDLEKAQLAALEDLRSYHAANLEAAAGRFPGLVVPGRTKAIGLTTCRGSRVSPKSLERGIAFVGPGARVHASARLEGEVVVGQGAIVDKGARLYNAVVMPWTYVGEMLSVRNAIVRSSELICVDTGAVVSITDAFLLADLRRPPAAEAIANLWHRMLGAMLLGLSLPLWPVAFIAAMVESPAAPLSARPLRGNRSSGNSRVVFRRWRFSSSVPVLSALPGLLSVVRGHLRLIGCTPLPPERASARQRGWELASDRAPSGLIGPALIELPHDAQWRERLMRDALYASVRTPTEDFRVAVMGLRRLFSPASWRTAERSRCMEADV